MRERMALDDIIFSPTIQSYPNSRLLFIEKGHRACHLAGHHMGKQITFFMTHEDEKEFLEAIQQLGSVRLIRNSFPIESEKEILLLQPVGTTPNDVNLSLVNDAVGSEPMQEFFPSSRSHCIDLAESEIVQFNRCKAVNTWLANGRLWFETKSHQAPKSAAFLKWANSLFQWVQSNYHKDPVGNFVAPHAFELYQAGKFQLGPPTKPPISLEERQRVLGLQ